MDTTDVLSAGPSLEVADGVSCTQERVQRAQSPTPAHIHIDVPSSDTPKAPRKRNRKRTRPPQHERRAAAGLSPKKRVRRRPGVRGVGLYTPESLAQAKALMSGMYLVRYPKPLILKISGKKKGSHIAPEPKNSPYFYLYTPPGFGN